jgi:hypothetical protein
MGSSKRADWQPLIAYSTNVHRGGSVAAIRRYLNRYTVPIARRVLGDRPAGLELHLDMASAAELREGAARAAFRRFLSARGLFLFSINAYPLTPFHARRVKEQVYSPSWAEPERPRWTNAIADIFVDLLPPHVTGSISTLGGAFRRREHGPAVFRKLARGYLQTVERLARLEEERGKTIVLAVEPEPETTFETAQDVIDFFEDHLLPRARSAWRGVSPARAEARLRRFFTVNFDTCHFSVLFEDPVESLRRLRRAGLAVGKVHVTNALALRHPHRSRAAYHDLLAMDEPRYFHQFCGRGRDGKVLWRDLDLDRLPRALRRGKHPDVTELRTHFHVPLYLQRFRRLRTTQEETLQALAEVQRTRASEHLVIETYTWPLLGRKGEGQDLVSGIAREFRWLLAALRS